MNNDLQYLTAVETQRNCIGRLHYLSWGEFGGVIDITELFIDRPPIVVNTDEIIDRTKALWQRQKLGNISPNKIPVIKHPVQLYR